MKIMIAGDEINTTPDLTVSVKIEDNPRSIPIFDLEVCIYNLSTGMVLT